MPRLVTPDQRDVRSVVRNLTRGSLVILMADGLPQPVCLAMITDLQLAPHSIRFLIGDAEPWIMEDGISFLVPVESPRMLATINTALQSGALSQNIGDWTEFDSVLPQS